ncbi:helix-turn-helix transcriptional regulator [Schaalia vaccimaxillae]|uniref:helix-turn-helix transcriptional regulator n=1 Tax=Schaalia vaccimaxillae TaxID=183916 RepID=UPI0003B36BEC|nr:WYL domain-containing protein [Schaalia vaccimaxillae]
MPEAVPVALSRLLSMVSWIGDHPGITIEELAQHFGRTKRQITRDIENLGQVGDSLPGRSFEVDWNLYASQAKLSIRTTLGADLPPRLTEAEATAIIVGLHAVSGALDHDLRERLPRVAMAVRHLSPGIPADSVVAAYQDEHPDQLDPILSALREQCQLGFTYLKSDGGASLRIVDPWQVSMGSQGWLLHGWCHQAQDQRTFRVDRMSDVHQIQACASQAPTSPPVQSPSSVRLTVGPGAQWLIDEAGAAVLGHEADGAMRIELRVWDEEWLEAMLIDISPFLIDAPTDLVERMRSRANAALHRWSTMPGLEFQEEE